MIELEILHYTDGELELEELGIKTSDDIESVEYKPITFIRIDAFGKARYEGRGLLYVGGTTFVTKLSYEELKEYLEREIIDKVYQLCPKCLGDGNLLRYNSPAFMSTNVATICDVCNGNKII